MNYHRHCPHDPGASLHLWFLSWVVQRAVHAALLWHATPVPKRHISKDRLSLVDVSDPPQILAPSIKIWQRAEGYKLRLVIPQVHRHLELA